MGYRTIKGRLAADPEEVQAGQITIVKFRVIENTGEYRGGKFIEHDTPTTHFVEAKFELGENVMATAHRGDKVVVTGNEYSSSWDDANGQKQYGRVIDADDVAVSLTHATAVITRKPRDE
ncbi:single-stranded DNA-binding protein [Leucobacter sp. wl10]|uniref:single-stranded DNA-binding protein n=1 Tax=Leucobacter sp. wl10 TaxID=2304677 RepID=UPI0013C2AC04|nr:single-stranded DNA-binding protein [Leucobacter sp. wl10]